MNPQLLLFENDSLSEDGFRLSGALKHQINQKQSRSRDCLLQELVEFSEFGGRTAVSSSAASQIPILTNEFWTAKQRAASSLHEVSYRACFKPQLPRFFIDRLTEPGATVYDPFMGRGTTVIESALLGRKPLGCDVNPLSRRLVEPRLSPPSLESVYERLLNLELTCSDELPSELGVFYHPETLAEICSLRRYLIERQESGEIDNIDNWIRMVAVNRLTGHSPGFFSVYTMPPNQAVSVQSQIKINERRNQVPPRRYVKEIILKKSKSLLADCTSDTRNDLSHVSSGAMLITRECF